MPPFRNETSPLERYGHNLTLLTRQRTFAPLATSEEAVTCVFQGLLRWKKTTNKYNPIILDLDGATRWPVIIEVIRRMAIGDAPDPLPAQQVIALDYEALLAPFSNERCRLPLGVPQQPSPNASELDLTEAESWDTLEQFFEKCFPHGIGPSLEAWVAPDVIHQRLHELFLAVHQTEGQVLFFVNHFHRLLGGEYQHYPIQAFDLLKPTLARGEIQLMGACTLTQYRQFIEQDAAMQRRFQEILIPDTQEEY